MAADFTSPDPALRLKLQAGPPDGIRAGPCRRLPTCRTLVKPALLSSAFESRATGEAGAHGLPPPGLWREMGHQVSACPSLSGRSVPRMLRSSCRGAWTCSVPRRGAARPARRSVLLHCPQSAGPAVLAGLTGCVCPAVTRVTAVTGSFRQSDHGGLGRNPPSGCAAGPVELCWLE